jgi:hypothetical protein
MNEHEEGFVRSFIEKNKQERTAMFLLQPKRRKEFLRSLAHFRGLDMRYAKVIPPHVAHTAEEWSRLLRSKGAPERCWVISEDLSRDGREVLLEEAFKETLGYGMGTVISCIPGRLGYFEDEDERRLLER